MKTLNSRPPLRQRRRRAWRRLFMALGVVVLVAAGALVLYGREIATRLIHVALEEAGVPADRIDIRRLGLTGLELGPLQLGGPDGPAASGIAAGWSLPSLLNGRLTYARLEGLTARAKVENGTLVIPGLPRPQGGGGGVPALPIDRLELAGARLDVEAGEIKLAATADAALTATSNEMNGQATINARITGAGPAPLHVVATLPQWNVRLQPENVEIILVKATLGVPNYSAELTEIDATAVTGAAMTMKLSAMLHDRAPSPRIVPLQVALDGRQEKDVMSMSGTVSSRDKALDVKFTGRHALNDNRGAVDIEAAPLRFVPDERQPKDLFPFAGDIVQSVTGAILARGQIAWGAALTSKAEITLQKLGFTTGVTALSDLDGKLVLASALPPRTAGVQHVTAKVQVAGLPPGDVDLRFSLPGDNRLHIERAAFNIAGGALELANITLRQGDPLASALRIRRLDLATMLGIIDIDGLSGSGTIGGEIPVRVDEAGVAIMSGRLGASGPGVVRYTGAALPDTGGASNDSLQLVRQALSDFHYTEMTLTLDRGTSGDGSLLINLKGSNPAVLQNHPFVFNIKLETNFDRLATILLDGYAAAESLMRGAVKR